MTTKLLVSIDRFKVFGLPKCINYTIGFEEQKSLDFEHLNLRD